MSPSCLPGDCGAAHIVNLPVTAAPEEPLCSILIRNRWRGFQTSLSVITQAGYQLLLLLVQEASTQSHDIDRQSGTGF